MELIVAARLGNIDGVQTALANGADINQFTSFGDTALIWAVHNGHFEIVKYLVNAGANVNKSNSSQTGPLTYAAIKNKWDIYIYLFPLCQYSKAQLSQHLKYAVKYNNLEMVQFLVQKNAPLNDRHGSSSETVLDIAFHSGHLNIANYLIRQDAESVSGHSKVHKYKNKINRNYTIMLIIKYFKHNPITIDSIQTTPFLCQHMKPEWIKMYWLSQFPAHPLRLVLSFAA